MKMRLIPKNSADVVGKLIYRSFRFYLEYSFLPSPPLLFAVAPPKMETWLGAAGLSYMKPIPPPFLVRIPGGCPEVRMADMLTMS